MGHKKNKKKTQQVVFNNIAYEEKSSKSKKPRQVEFEKEPEITFPKTTLSKSNISDSKLETLTTDELILALAGFAEEEFKQLKSIKEETWTSRIKPEVAKQLYLKIQMLNENTYKTTFFSLAESSMIEATIEHVTNNPIESSNIKIEINENGELSFDDIGFKKFEESNDSTDDLESDQSSGSFESYSDLNVLKKEQEKEDKLTVPLDLTGDLEQIKEKNQQNYLYKICARKNKNYENDITPNVKTLNKKMPEINKQFVVGNNFDSNQKNMAKLSPRLDQARKNFLENRTNKSEDHEKIIKEKQESLENLEQDVSKYVQLKKDMLSIYENRAIDCDNVRSLYEGNLKLQVEEHEKVISPIKQDIEKACKERDEIISNSSQRILAKKNSYKDDSTQGMLKFQSDSQNAKKQHDQKIEQLLQQKINLGQGINLKEKQILTLDNESEDIKFEKIKLSGATNILAILSSSKSNSIEECFKQELATQLQQIWPLLTEEYQNYLLEKGVEKPSVMLSESNETTLDSEPEFVEKPIELAQAINAPTLETLNAPENFQASGKNQSTAQQENKIIDKDHQLNLIKFENAEYLEKNNQSYISNAKELEKLDKEFKKFEVKKSENNSDAKQVFADVKQIFTDYLATKHWKRPANKKACKSLLDLIDNFEKSNTQQSIDFTDGQLKSLRMQLENIVFNNPYGISKSGSFFPGCIEAIQKIDDYFISVDQQKIESEIKNEKNKILTAQTEYSKAYSNHLFLIKENMAKDLCEIQEIKQKIEKNNQEFPQAKQKLEQEKKQLIEKNKLIQQQANANVELINDWAERNLEIEKQNHKKLLEQQTEKQTRLEQQLENQVSKLKEESKNLQEKIDLKTENNENSRMLLKEDEQNKTEKSKEDINTLNFILKHSQSGKYSLKDFQGLIQAKENIFNRKEVKGEFAQLGNDITGVFADYTNNPIYQSVYDQVLFGRLNGKINSNMIIASLKDKNSLANFVKQTLGLTIEGNENYLIAAIIHAYTDHAYNFAKSTDKFDEKAEKTFLENFKNMIYQAQFFSKQNKFSGNDNLSKKLVELDEIRQEYKRRAQNTETSTTPQRSQTMPNISSTETQKDIKRSQTMPNISSKTKPLVADFRSDIFGLYVSQQKTIEKIAPNIKLTGNAVSGSISQLADRLTQYFSENKVNFSSKENFENTLSQAFGSITPKNDLESALLKSEFKMDKSGFFTKYEHGLSKNDIGEYQKVVLQAKLLLMIQATANNWEKNLSETITIGMAYTKIKNAIGYCKNYYAENQSKADDFYQKLAQYEKHYENLANQNPKVVTDYQNN